MSEPLVTVFIPVYNSEKYIKEALESIIRQTYKNLEILLVDDGSSDRSAEIIKSFRNPRIRLLKNEKNMGIPYTRNVGLREAKGKYMAIMDSDDIADPERIETQVRYLENHPDIDVCASNYIRFGERGGKKVRAPFTTPEALKIMLLFYNPIANPSAMVRLGTLKKHGLIYNEQFFVAQDYELWSRLCQVGKITILPEFLLLYRFGHENISKKSTEKKAERRRKLIGEIHARLIRDYGINLNEEEIRTFNEFFTESYGGSLARPDLVPLVVEKLKKWNETKNVFDHRLFLQVLDYCILFAISHHKQTVSQKLAWYNTLISDKNVRDKLILSAKHAYHRMRKVL